MMQISVLAIAITIVMAAALDTGCGSSSDVTISPTFSSINANVLQAKCVTCHGGASSSGGIDLSSYAQVVSGAVVAGSPSSSKLYQQVSAGTMPKNGSKLSDQNIAAIAEWITSGAADN